LDDLIKRGAREEAMLEATEPEDSEPGGSRHASQSKLMETGESRTASPDHCDPGTDAATLLDAGSGGGK